MYVISYPYPYIFLTILTKGPLEILLACLLAIAKSMVMKQWHMLCGWPRYTMSRRHIIPVWPAWKLCEASVSHINDTLPIMRACWHRINPCNAGPVYIRGKNLVITAPADGLARARPSAGTVMTTKLAKFFTFYCKLDVNDFEYGLVKWTLYSQSLTKFRDMLALPVCIKYR